MTEANALSADSESSVRVERESSESLLLAAAVPSGSRVGVGCRLCYVF